MRTKPKKTLSEMSSGFSSFSVTRVPPSVQPQGHIILIFLLLFIYLKNLILFSLTCLARFNFRWALAFLVSFCLTLTASLFTLSLEEDQLSLTPISCKACSRGILPIKFPKSTVTVLLATLVPPHWILTSQSHYRCSQGCPQPSHLQQGLLYLLV